MAASKAKASEDQLGNLAQAATQKAVTAPAKAAPPPPAQPTPFDVGKFAGIFAAIGLALGALGTALVSALGGLFSLSWWQIPLALVGVVLLISLPAVVFAWFKLRSRNLGPILDANGWAVNARARINIPFGTALTQLAKLPANAERSMQDPYAEESTPWGWYFVMLIAAGAGLAWYLGWWAL
jgi:Na+(H+)/acetate symporter ActP